MLGFPPQFDSNPVYYRKLRYTATSALQALPVTSRALASTVIAVSALAIPLATYGLYESVRLRSIEVWGVDSGALVNPLALTTVGVELDSVNGNSRRVTGTGNAEAPAHLFVRPNKGSIGDRWNTPSNSTDLFLLTCPAGSIVEVAFDFTLNSSVSSGPPYGSPIGGLTVGALYYGQLDLSSGTNFLVPTLLNPANLQ